MNELEPIKPQIVEGKIVRVCVVCGEGKKVSQFYKESLNLIDGGDGISKDCRACRMKEERIKKDIHFREIGWKRPEKNT